MMPTSLFGITSIICFSLPILAILYFRLYRHASLIALMVYYALTILRCIGSNSVPPSPVFTNTWDVLYSYVETPLMLLSLLFFCPAKQRQQKIRVVMGLFAVYELVVASLFGFTPQACLYIMAPGLLVIVLYSLYLFLRQVRFTLTHRKNGGRVLMLGALLFSYGCYLFLFYAYFVQAKPDVSGIYALHFVSASMASVMMAGGLYLMRHRIKELQELKVTRRELQLIFGS